MKGLWKETKYQRKSYGEGNFETVLKAEGAGGEALGKYEVQIGERLYTKDEADELFQKAKEEIAKRSFGVKTNRSNASKTS